MTWRTLGEAIESAVAKGIVDTGEGAVGAAPRAGKGTRTEARAKFTEPRQAGGENLNGASKTHMRPALPKVSRRGPTPIESAPPLCVGPRLVIDNSGRETHEGGRRLPAYRCSPRRKARELKLRVISGRAGARVAGTVPVHSAPPDCIPNAVM